MKASVLPGMNNDKYNVIKYVEAEQKESDVIPEEKDNKQQGHQKQFLSDGKDDSQTEIYEKQLKEMNDQLEEMKRKNLEDSIKYLNQYKNKEEYIIGGPVPAGMYNLVSASNKMALYCALRSGHGPSANARDGKKGMEKIELDLLDDVNNEIKKSIQIGIKEAEAVRINKHRDAKHKIRRIKIYIDPKEENKFDKSLNRYTDNKPDAMGEEPKSDTIENESKHIDTKA